MIDQNIHLQLSHIVWRLIDSSGLEVTCNALESGHLSCNSMSTERESVAGGNMMIDSCLRSLCNTWSTGAPDLSPEALALLLRTTSAAIETYRVNAPEPVVVWTGPNVDGSFLRMTREVVREIIRNATQHLLVVGYWICGRVGSADIVEEIILSLYNAALRGVSLTFVFDEHIRSGGIDNFHVLTSLWPNSAALPNILTWRLPVDDRYLKLHAKLLVADRSDGLVTSANLTSYAMDRNIEMGVRIAGKPAAYIVRHFDLLAQTGVLEQYERNCHK